MDNTPQIADIYRFDWVSSSGSGTRYFLVLSDIKRPDGWLTWSYSTNRTETRFFKNYSDGVVSGTYTKVA